MSPEVVEVAVSLVVGACLGAGFARCLLAGAPSPAGHPVAAPRHDGDAHHHEAGEILTREVYQGRPRRLHACTTCAHRIWVEE